MTIYGRCRHTAGACGHGEAAAAFGDLDDQHELVGAQPALRAIDLYVSYITCIHS